MPQREMIVMNQNVASGYGDECPVCHGTHWELFNAAVFDYGEPEELTFAQKCCKCGGIMRSQDKTGVPEQFHDADYSKFNFGVYHTDIGKLKELCQSFLRDFPKWEKNGKGLYLWSKTPGSGKTFLCCCLAKSVMMMHDLQMRFVTVPDYISLVGESYKREKGQEDASGVYRTCSLLVFDDIGSQNKGEWQEQELFRLINGRMEKGNVTIFSSNFPPEGLNVNERTKDRIMKSSIVVQMPEEGIRKKIAAQEQTDFLKGIGII